MNHRISLHLAAALLCAAASARAQTNRAENTMFDSDLRTWTPSTFPPGIPGTTEWSPLSISGTGGSLRITNSYAPTAPNFGWVRVEQCIAGGTLATSPYTVTANVLIAAGQSGTVYAQIGADFYDSLHCDGPPSWTEGASVVGGPGGTGGAWQPLTFTTTVHPSSPGTRSARFWIQLTKRAEGVVGTIEANFDDVSFRGPARFVKGDMNRDGETDLLVHNKVTGRNEVWLMNNSVRDGLPVAITPDPPSLDWVIAGTDDFDGDQQNDLLMWNQATGQAQFWLMNGVNRLGTVNLVGALPLPWKPSATADFNHDGQPDIVYRNFATQKIVIWTMSGTTKLGEIVPVPDQAVDGNWEIVASLDFNNDANTDFLWYNATSGKIVLWYMDASVVRTAGLFTNPPNAGDNNWKVLAGGDYGIALNGLWDTKDIVWRNETSGRFVVWHLDNAGNRTFGTFTTPVEPTPFPTDWTIAGPR